MNDIVRLRYLLNCVQKEGNKKYTELLAPLGITPNQSEVLQVLEACEPLSLKELGELLICEQKSPSRLVQRLVNNQLIYKSKDLVDSRRSVLHLTKAGRDLLPAIKEKEQAFNEHISQTLQEAIEPAAFNQILAKQIAGTASEKKILQREQLAEKSLSN
ncbi:MarR family winged helix-turn-helix transcriptional regulator [Vagococcus entomophilus]|uniref:Transcriptional regulator n=1 Tax=Vagococcus entomophilus TaxID=1160095 RepID=A0A430AFP2_9ENTE|nr:MarR family winged helix-turn-helix transcriptional regulator [Vagococcus entomophilus]RSU06560.1 transcriptional regulator [Vagococcus entomophilus]